MANRSEEALPPERSGLARHEGELKDEPVDNAGQAVKNCEFQ